MQSVLFIHSAGAQGPGEGSSRFLERLREAAADLEIEAPLMPTPDNPEAAPWLAATAARVAKISAPFVLLGHSLGGSIILKHLAERGVPPGLAGAVTLAAPFWGTEGWNYPDHGLPADAGEKLRDLRLTMLFCRDDDVVEADHADHYRNLVPTAAIRTIDGDHEFRTGDVGAVVEAIRALRAPA